jgi:hypothetical protein
LCQAAPAKYRLRFNFVGIDAECVICVALCLGNVASVPPVNGKRGVNGSAFRARFLGNYQRSKRFFRLSFAVPQCRKFKGRSSLSRIGAQSLLKGGNGFITRAGLESQVANSMHRMRTALGVLHGWQRNRFARSLKTFGTASIGIQCQCQVGPRSRHAGINGECLTVSGDGRGMITRLLCCDAARECFTRLCA